MGRLKICFFFEKNCCVAYQASSKRLITHTLDSVNISPNQSKKLLAQSFDSHTFRLVKNRRCIADKKEIFWRRLLLWQKNWSGFSCIKAHARLKGDLIEWADVDSALAFTTANHFMHHRALKTAAPFKLCKNFVRWREIGFVRVDVIVALLIAKIGRLVLLLIFSCVTLF